MPWHLFKTLIILLAFSTRVCPNPLTDSDEDFDEEKDSSVVTLLGGRYRRELLQSFSAGSEPGQVFYKGKSLHYTTGGNIIKYNTTETTPYIKLPSNDKLLSIRGIILQEMNYALLYMSKNGATHSVRACHTSADHQLVHDATTDSAIVVCRPRKAAAKAEVYVMPMTIDTTELLPRVKIETYRIRQFGDDVPALTIEPTTGDIVYLQNTGKNTTDMFRLTRLSGMLAKPETCVNKINKMAASLSGLGDMVSIVVDSPDLPVAYAATFPSKTSVGDVDEYLRRDYVCVLRSEMTQKEEDEKTQTFRNKNVVASLKFIAEMAAIDARDTELDASC